FNRKSRVFSSQIPHLSESNAFILCEYPHLTRKSCIFSSQIPHLSENHTFSLQESSI
ncbi:hypothetical protein CP061683_1839, partial [Chlamydia psittaci 06-1683]